MKAIIAALVLLLAPAAFAGSLYDRMVAECGERPAAMFFCVNQYYSTIANQVTKVDQAYCTIEADKAKVSGTAESAFINHCLVGRVAGGTPAIAAQPAQPQAVAQPPLKSVSELLAQQAQSPLANKELPIAVSYRTAKMGPGLVARFDSMSGRALSLIATFKNPTLRTVQRIRIDVPPRGTREIGHAEGWVVASGDEIELYHAEYQPMRVVVP